MYNTRLRQRTWAEAAAYGVAMIQAADVRRTGQLARWEVAFVMQCMGFDFDFANGFSIGIVREDGFVGVAELSWFYCGLW